MNSSTDSSGVLYEVVISAEWDTAIVRNESLGKKVSSDDLLPSHPWLAELFFPFLWTYYWIIWLLSESVARFAIPDSCVTWQTTGMPWTLATVRPAANQSSTNDHVVAAVITNTELEIRYSTDEFATTREKFSLKQNQDPVYRKMGWSSDGRYLAVVDSTGNLTIYDCLNAESCSLKIKQQWKRGSRMLRSCMVSSVMWINSSDRCGDEGVLIYYSNGAADLFRLNDQNIVAGWSVNSRSLIPGGLMKSVISATYLSSQNLIITASSINAVVDEDLNSPWMAGLAAWIPIDEPPFIRLMSDDESQDARLGQRVYKRFVKATDGVVRMAVNPSETELVTLFLSGAIAVWQISFREVKFRRIWTAKELPQYGSSHEFDGSRKRTPSDRRNSNFPQDVRWWSDTAIILSQTGGAVSLLDVGGRELVNIAHGSFEQFSPGCAITANLAGKFLILEQSISGKDWKRNNSRADITLSSDDSKEEENDNAVSVMTEVLESLGVGGDRPVRIPPKKPPGASFRLNCFQIASPLEMFHRKLTEELYDEALLLAERFGLDTDLVYQKRWMKSKVTKASIVDYLCKVSSKAWVLRECLTRVPDHPDVARELLMVGLRFTDRTSIARLNPESCDMSKGKTSFIFDVSKLTPEQHAVIGYRRQLLRFESILSIYEQILGGGEKAVRYFMADEYADMRRKSFLEIALQYAHQCKPQELHTLRYLRYSDLKNFWLDILSNFPETFSPESYQFLIPSVLNDEVVETQHAVPTTKDWCLQEPFDTVTDQESLTGENDLLKLQASLTAGDAFAVDRITNWVESRVIEIEKRTGLIDLAKQLVQVAAAKNIRGLDNLKDELDTLTILVYEAGQTSLGLAELRKLDNRQVLRLLMDKPGESFPVVFRSRMLPFLKRCDRAAPGAQYALLEDYMSEIAGDPQHTLDKCLKIFQQSLPGLPDPALPSPINAMQLAVKCILTCSRTDQIEQIKAVLECLPSRETLHGGDVTLFQKIDSIQDLIHCVEFAERFGVKLSVKSAQEVRVAESRVVEFISHLLQMAVKKMPNFGELEWRDIYGQYIKICKRVFRSLSDEKMVELFANALLSSGKNQYMDLAAKFLPILPTTSPAPPKHVTTEVWAVSNRLSASVSSKILLSVGKEYLVNSDSWKDPKIKLAEKCFAWTKGMGCGDAKMETGIVDSLKVLHALGVDASPLDVWTSADRFTFIKQVLDEKSDSYKHPSRLLDLASLLNMTEANRVMEAVAEKSFERKDFGFCRDLCEKLIEEKRPSSWDLCVKLAAASDFHDYAFKDTILVFAVANCPDERLLEVMALRNKVSMDKLKLNPNPSPPRDSSVEPISKLPIDPCYTSPRLSSATKTLPLSSVKDHLNNLIWYSDSLVEDSLRLLNGDQGKKISSGDRDARLISTALECFSVDTGLAFSCIGVLSDKSRGETFFDLLPPTPCVERLPGYFYGLELCCLQPGCDIANCLRLSYNDVVLKAQGTPVPDAAAARLTRLLQQQAAKFRPKRPLLSGSSSVGEPESAQAIPAVSSGNAARKPMSTVLRGMDETKFQSNAEYRKSFLLRAAVTKDPDVLRKVVDVGDQYGVPGWEIVSAGIKYLFTTSGISLDQLEGFLKKISDLTARLKEKKVEFLRFSGMQIQPYMTNADMFVLEAYSDFLSDIKKT